MKQTSKTFIVYASIVVIGFCGIFIISRFLDRNRAPVPDDSDIAIEGKRLKGFILGTEGLIADWYWMSSLQYVGDKLAKSQSDYVNLNDLRSFNMRLLYPYLDNATDLDPKFIAAYTYGAMVLPAIDPDKAIKLTQKGIANNPDNWRLYQYQGYIYWRLKEYAKAAEAYDRGSQIEGAAQFMKMMAAAMKTQGGSRDTAREMYSQMLAEAKDQSTIDNTRLRLMELDSLDERDAIQSAINKTKEISGQCPRALEEILPLLKNIKLTAGKDFRLDDENNLIDPSGAPYILDRETCEVKLDPARTKIPQM